MDLINKLNMLWSQNLQKNKLKRNLINRFVYLKKKENKLQEADNIQLLSINEKKVKKPKKEFKTNVALLPCFAFPEGEAKQRSPASPQRGNYASLFPFGEKRGKREVIFQENEGPTSLGRAKGSKKQNFKCSYFFSRKTKNTGR